MKGLIGKKVGMTQVYDENGVLIPVTVIEAGPCVVTDVKTSERDGYTAIQLVTVSARRRMSRRPVPGISRRRG